MDKQEIKKQCLEATVEKQVIKALGSLVSVIAACITKINKCFFLLVEIQVQVPNAAIQQVFAIAITNEQAKDLMEAGIEHCEISNTIPQTKIGFQANLKCVLTENNDALLVFDTFPVVLDPPHKLVLFKTKVCPVLGDD